MEPEVFFKALRRTRRDWRVGSERPNDRALRCDGHCPITAVAACLEPADPPWRLSEWSAAAAQLGLDATFAHDIVCAADDASDSPLRAALLTACGLLVSP